jgi:3-oxocholest-4-en-26-oyl-CoA dehydrogenase beta subunit
MNATCDPADDAPMDFRFDDRQRAAQDVAVSVFAGRPGNGAGIDRDAWRLLAETSVTGLGLAEDVGGFGGGVLELCALLIEQGRSVVPVPVIETMLAAGPAIDRFGTAAQRRELLPDIAAGRRIVVPALHDAAGPGGRFGVRASRVGALWELDGHATCLPYGSEADLLLVPATRDDGTSAVFLLDPAARGVEREAQSAMSGRPQAYLVLRGVACEGDAVLGADGAVVRQFLVDRSVLGVCAQQVGVLDEALRLTVKYVSEREQFGRVIGSFQAVALRAADMYAAVESCRVTMWRAAWLLEVGGPAASALALAKYWAAQAGFAVSLAAHHLHGGMGVVTDYPLHRHTLWARENELAFGAATEQLARIGEQLAGTGPGL